MRPQKASGAREALYSMRLGRRVPTADPDPRVAAQATLFVGKGVQSPAWSAKQMLHPDQRVRANAVESIWGLDTQPAVQLLEKCIDDKNTRVVGNALLGLHITGHRDLERELVFSSKHALPDRRSMARGGKAFGRNQRLRGALLPTPTPATVSLPAVPRRGHSRARSPLPLAARRRKARGHPPRSRSGHP
jgi:hypothetical protein